MHVRDERQRPEAPEDALDLRNCAQVLAIVKCDRNCKLQVPGAMAISIARFRFNCEVYIYITGKNEFAMQETVSKDRLMMTEFQISGINIPEA